MMNSRTIPIRTLPELISHYERVEQKIVDNYEERAKVGHAKWDNHELSMVREFLGFLRDLDAEVEIEKIKNDHDLGWQRVKKYVTLAMAEIQRNCPDGPVMRDSVKEGE